MNHLQHTTWFYHRNQFRVLKLNILQQILLSLSATWLCFPGLRSHMKSYSARNSCHRACLGLNFFCVLKNVFATLSVLTTNECPRDRLSKPANSVPPQPFLFHVLSIVVQHHSISYFQRPLDDLLELIRHQLLCPTHQCALQMVTQNQAIWV